MKGLSIEFLSVIVFFNQILFLWLRTLNVRYTANGKMISAIITGNAISLLWMIGITIGVTSMMEGYILPIVCHLVGGSIGTWLGMKKEIKNGKQ